MPFTPISFEAHKALKVADSNECFHVENSHVLPITVFEVQSAATSFPLVFVKNSETGQLQFVAMTSAVLGKNAFVKDGKWQASHKLGILDCYPFRLIKDQQSKDVMHVAIDTDSDRVGSKKGEMLYDKTGDETSWFSDKKNALGKYYEQTVQTQLFVKELLKFGLLKENTLNISVDGQDRALNAIYLIDQEKLNGLTDDQFLDLRKRGLLTIIYAQMTSLGNIKNLMEAEG